MTSRPAPVRKETANVEFPAATWTSFDRYSRYGAIARAIRANLGPGTHHVLDVGDDSGWLRLFDEQLTAVSLDINVNPERLDGTISLVGDGAHLPVHDRSVDAVISSDALEHVSPDDRGAFLCELTRVSNLVVVAAPFDTPGVAGAEEFARRYAAAAMEAPQPQLEEHAGYGLPSLDETVAALTRAGLDVVATGNGNLQDWLLGMVLKHQLGSRPALGDLDLGFDVLYNMLLAGRNDLPPYYRHVLVGRRGQPVERGAVSTPGTDEVETSAVYAALLAASLAEVSRQDIEQRADVLEAQQQLFAEHLMERFSGVEAALMQLFERMDELRSLATSTDDLVRHPLKYFKSRLRRGEAAGG
jgi:hypothetical protein